MSKFFQSLDEEKQEIKRKTTEILEKSEEKLSKRDKKLKELAERVEETRATGKNFEKQFKKLINDLKKYSSYFENNEVPEFLVEFFNDERVKASKPMNSAAIGFLSQYAVQEVQTREVKTSGEKKIIKKEEKDLESILKVEDDNQKEKELCRLLGRTSDPDRKSEILAALFPVYSRMKDARKMVEVLKNLDFSRDNSHTKSIAEKIDIYLGKIFNILMDSGDEEACKDYSSLLSLLENRDVPTSAVRDRLLEFESLKLGKIVDSDDPLFRLLYLVRSNLWKEAFGHYEVHLQLFEDLNARGFSHLISLVLVLIEFSRLAVSNGEYELAFKIYLKCHNTGRVDLRLQLYALCIILSDKLVADPFFQEFIDLFKRFDANYLCLPSRDLFIELCRAFYYLNILDFPAAAVIIETVTGFETSARLEVLANALYQERCIRREWVN